MLTVEQITAHLERVIAEATLAGNQVDLRNAQRAGGFLMQAAEVNGDKELARHFRNLAAKAANQAEELGKK